MAQALWYVAADLLACREERRMVVVLTDGQPDDPPEVLRLLALCRQAGMRRWGWASASACSTSSRPPSRSARRRTSSGAFGVAERLLVGAAA